MIRSKRFAFTALAMAVLCASALVVARGPRRPCKATPPTASGFISETPVSPATAAPGKAASIGGRRRSLPRRRCRSTALESCCATRRATCRPIRRRCCRTRTSPISTPSSSRCLARGRRKRLRVLNKVGALIRALGSDGYSEAAGTPPGFGPRARAHVIPRLRACVRGAGRGQAPTR